MKKVLILGGYGNFGKNISLALAKDNMPIVIAGRNLKKAEKLKAEITQKHPASHIETAAFDAQHDILSQLQQIKPYLVIDTCGPFQKKSYATPLSCIKMQIHYLDLADGRDYVTAITSLDQPAKDAGCIVISAASTIPCLSSAVIDHFKKEFKQIDSLQYGITPGQKSPRGLATTQSILSYLGKALAPSPATEKKRYGWQDLYRQTYPVLGKRWMANCDVADIDLFAKTFHIKKIQFSAGMESSTLHLGMWILSWMVRIGLPLHLGAHSKTLLRLSHYFDTAGSDQGGMHMILKGRDTNGKPKTINWFLIAKHGDGPNIPITPAIILARKICDGELLAFIGANPCIDLMTLDEYLQHLSALHIKTYTTYT
jgi:hypothetical protein